MTSDLHNSQVATRRDCIQHALRQTLGLLHSAAAARPVRLPGMSLVTMAAAFKPSCTKTCRIKSVKKHNDVNQKELCENFDKRQFNQKFSLGRLKMKSKSQRVCVCLVTDRNINESHFDVDGGTKTSFWSVLLVLQLFCDCVVCV